jgi:hypothetical protein
MMKHIAILAALVLLTACQKEPSPMTKLAVTILLRTNETPPIAGGKIKLIFDGGAVTVTSDAKGHASATGKAVLDQRWHWVNIGFTPFSWPLRADHIAFAAELDHSVRIDGRVVHYPVLYKVNLFRDSNGDTWNPGVRVFGPDAQGEFTIDLDRDNNGIPLDGKMLMAPNNGYRVSGSLDDPKAGEPVKLDLEFVQEHWSQAQ